MDNMDTYIENMIRERIEYEKQAKKLFIEEGEKVFSLSKANKWGCDNFEDMHSEDKEKQHNLKLVDAFGFIGLEYAKYLSPIVGSINTEVKYYVLYKNEVYEVERFHGSYIRIIFVPNLADSFKNKLLKFEDILEYAKNMEIKDIDS